MIPVGVGHQELYVISRRTIVGQDVSASIPNSGARIDEDSLRTRANLYTGRVSSVAHGMGAWAGY